MQGVLPKRLGCVLTGEELDEGLGSWICLAQPWWVQLFQVSQPGLDPEPVWDAYTAGGSLTQYAAVPAHLTSVSQGNIKAQ